MSDLPHLDGVRRFKAGSALERFVAAKSESIVIIWALASFLVLWTPYCLEHWVERTYERSNQIGGTAFR
jgi:hypothetical protein